MKKVMIVDDSMIIRQRLKKLFENKGFEVVAEVESGEKAIRRFRECKPDIITMDIALPGMSGIDAVKKLTDMDPDTKIIMLTGMGERTNVLKAIKLGAVHFIVKPFQESKVIEVVNEVLGINPDEENEQKNVEENSTEENNNVEQNESEENSSEDNNVEQKDNERDSEEDSDQENVKEHEDDEESSTEQNDDEENNEENVKPIVD